MKYDIIKSRIKALDAEGDWLCMIAVNIRVIMMENTDIIATAMDVIGMQ